MALGVLLTGDSVRRDGSEKGQRSSCSEGPGLVTRGIESSLRGEGEGREEAREGGSPTAGSGSFVQGCVTPYRALSP